MKYLKKEETDNLKLVTNKKLEMAEMKKNFWRKYRDGDQLILPREPKKPEKIPEGMKIGELLDRKRLERLDRQRRAEEMWAEVRATIAFIEMYDVLEPDIELPEGWKPHEVLTSEIKLPEGWKSKEIENGLKFEDSGWKIPDLINSMTETAEKEKSRNALVDVKFKFGRHNLNSETNPTIVVGAVVPEDSREEHLKKNKKNPFILVGKVEKKKKETQVKDLIKIFDKKTKEDMSLPEYSEIHGDRGVGDVMGVEMTSERDGDSPWHGEKHHGRLQTDLERFHYVQEIPKDLECLARGNKQVTDAAMTARVGGRFRDYCVGKPQGDAADQGDQPGARDMTQFGRDQPVEMRKSFVTKQEEKLDLRQHETKFLVQFIN